MWLAFPFKLFLNLISYFSIGIVFFSYLRMQLYFFAFLCPSLWTKERKKCGCNIIIILLCWQGEDIDRLKYYLSFVGRQMDSQLAHFEAKKKILRLCIFRPKATACFAGITSLLSRFRNSNFNGEKTKAFFKTKKNKLFSEVESKIVV